MATLERLRLTLDIFLSMTAHCYIIYKDKESIVRHNNHRMLFKLKFIKLHVSAHL